MICIFIMLKTVGDFYLNLIGIVFLLFIRIHTSIYFTRSSTWMNVAWPPTFHWIRVCPQVEVLSDDILFLFFFPLFHGLPLVKFFSSLMALERHKGLVKSHYSFNPTWTFFGIFRNVGNFEKFSITIMSL